MIVELNTETFKDYARTARKPLIVQFYRKTNAPCRYMSAMLDKLEPEFPAFQFVRINKDENPILADNYKASMTPMLFLFIRVNYLERKAMQPVETSVRAWLKTMMLKLELPQENT